jgi:hypothetical protein
VAVRRLVRAHARPAPEEAPEVRGLGERALQPGRGDLEGVALAQVAELVGDPLAEVQRHAVRMVDEQPKRVGADDLGEQHLDVGRRRREAGLDVVLQAGHHCFLRQ